MSFGRWLLVNSFSIFLVSLFVLGYFYREELQLDQAYHELFSVELEQVVKKSLDPVTTPKKATEPPKLTVQSKIKVESSKQPSKIEKLPSTIGSLQQKIDSEELNVNKTENVQLVVPPVLDSKPINHQVGDIDDLLQTARQAYWDKKYSESINIYQQLMVKDQTNADIPGELGNIYYALNDYPNASTLYFQAAQLLISQNQQDRARLLVSPITAMNRELGTQLSEQLQ